MRHRILFYSNIEIDYILLSSIADTFPAYCECVLLVPNTGRALKLLDESKWSKVIVFSKADVPSHYTGIIGGAQDVLRLRRGFESILEEGMFNLIVTLDAFKIRDVILFEYINRKRIPHLVISMFVGNRFFSELRKIRIQQTLVHTVYLWLIGAFRWRYLEYKIKSSDVNGIRLLKGYRPSYTLSIMNSKQLLTPRFRNLGSFGFPLQLVEREIDLKCRVLILVSSLQANRQSNYWERLSLIIDQLKGFEIILKDHPQASTPIPEAIQIKADMIIDKENNVEDFVFKSKNINVVCGSGSTALITLSWMGCASLDISNLLDIDRTRTQYYNEYMRHGDVVMIQSISELRKMLKATSVIISKKLKNQKLLNTIFDDLF